MRFVMDWTSFLSWRYARVAARKPRPRHVVGDVEVRRVAAPTVPVAAHEGIDEEAVRRPGKVLGVFIDGFEDERHFVVFIFVGDGLVAVGVGLGVGDGDAVGGGMELAPALHVRPHAADEVGRGLLPTVSYSVSRVSFATESA